MVHSRLRFKELMNHDDGSVAAMSGPRDVTENTVRVVFERLETWRFGECGLTCQNEAAEITPQSVIDRTRPRNTPRHSHNSLRHCELDIKQAEKQICAPILHTLTADQKIRRLAAQTIKRYIVKADQQRPSCEWLSKDDHDEVEKISELSWIHSIAKQSKLEIQWEEVHWYQRDTENCTSQ